MTTFTVAINQVESLYVGYFGRAGDPSGTNYWVSQLQAGTTTLAAIARSFAVQPEATAKYPYLANPTISDPAIFINQVYQNMFNHVADAAGLAYWTAQLTAASGNPAAIGSMILNIISGATGVDDTTIRNKVDVAQDFTVKATNSGTTWNAAAQAQSAAEITATNDTAASVTAQKAATDAYIASAPGPQQNFTLNIDTLTASGMNSNFNAPLIFNAPNGALVQSLQAGDSATDTAPLTGPGLSNGGTFTAILNSTVQVPLVTLKGIPTHTVTNLAVAGSAGGYQGDITGLVTFNNVNSTGLVTIGTAGNGIDKGGVAGTTTTGATLLSTVNINNVVGTSANSATTISVNTAALAGAADVLNINVIGPLGLTGAGNQNTVAVKNDTAVAATAANTYETINVAATGATFMALSDGAMGILSTTKINVAGAGATTLFGAVAGEFGKLTTIDASTQTGGVTITGATTGATGLLTGNTVLSSFKGGTGADSLDVSSLTAAQLQAITATNLDGGTGTARDTLVVSSLEANSTVAVNNSGFEVLTISSTGTATAIVYDHSKWGAGIDTITLLDAEVTAGATFNNLTSGITFNLANNLGGFTQAFNSAGTALTDAVTLNITGAGAAVNLFTLTGFETITETIANTTTSGAFTWQGVNATASAGANVTHNLTSNYSGTGGLVLTIAQENIGTGGTLILSGTGTAGITFTAAPVLGTLNASAYHTTAAAGDAGIVYGAAASSAQSILGSNGADTFLGSAFADTINGGAGNDLITGNALGDTIGVGSGNDTIFYIGNADTGTGVLASGATVTAATGFDIVTGMGNNEKVNLAGLANLALADGAIAVSPTFATATANLVVLVTGSWNAATGVFTSGAASVTNNDYLLQYNGGTTTTTVNSVMLVDIVGTVTAASASEVITLTVV